TLSDPFFSWTVLDPTIGSGGSTDTPAFGRSAACGSYSSALLALKGKAAESCCVAASFAVRSSDESTSGFGAAEPETVARLFGSMAGRVSGRRFFDLAMIQFSL